MSSIVGSRCRAGVGTKAAVIQLVRTMAVEWGPHQVWTNAIAPTVVRTLEGAQMAQSFAEVHRSIGWAAIYASPMKRTIATAKPLCEALGLEMQLADGLKEIRYGKWENKSADFVKQHYWDAYVRC
jgi:broad specificity phosphatase PhoE